MTSGSSGSRAARGHASNSWRLTVNRLAKHYKFVHTPQHPGRVA